MDARFAKAHQEWLDKHIQTRKGEARRRLSQGHAHAEKAMLEHIWWPAFSHFDYLHPEYEVTDFFGGRRYIDYAYIRAGIFIAIEVDPFGTHYDKLNRRQYSDQWVRQMHLFNDSWQFVRISLDDITDRPRLWQQLLQQMVGRLFGEKDITYELGARERDIMRLAIRLNRSVKLCDVRAQLDCGYDAARKQLTLLEDKQWLIPDGNGKKRIHTWRVNPARKLPPS